MKKNDERQICPSDTQCMSGFIGTILALVISVLAWVQKFSYLPSFAKQDCPEFCEFTRTIEKLKEITIQAEALSKSVPSTKKKKEEEDCICIQDQVSDDERENVQVLFGEIPKMKRSDSCTKCCEKVPSDSKVVYVEAYPAKEFEQKSSETQTSSAQLQDRTTEPTVNLYSEKETQDTREVKIGAVQPSKIECVCDQTQVSETSLPDVRKAQEEQAVRREEVTQSYDDRGGSYAAHKQYKTSMDLKRSYLASKQSRTSDEEIAEVYRTLVSEDTYDAEYEEEEEVNYFDMLCSEQYRPCRQQDASPYYQYPPVRQPPQVRQPSPYTKREPVPMRQPRPPTYPSYESSHKQPYECGRDGGGNPIYCYPTQNRPKPTQSFPRPFPVSYSPYPRESRPQKPAHQTPKHYVPPQYYLPQQYSSRSPSSSSSRRSTSPVRECEPDCPTSKHSLRSRTPPVAASTPRKRGSSPVRECEPECVGSKHSLKSQKRSPSGERVCELECLGSKHSIKGKRRSPVSARECQLECPRSKHTLRREEEENVECIPQCPGYVKKHPRDDCIPECPGYAYRRRAQRSPRRSEGKARECELDCPGSKHSIKTKSPPPDGGTPDLKDDRSKDPCIPNCIRYKPREEEKFLRKECLDDCPGVQFRAPSKDIQRTKRYAPKKSTSGQKGKKVPKPSQKQIGAQATGEFQYTGSGRMVAMMPNGAIPINPYSVQEFETEKPTNKRVPSDPYY